jgi:hypothetical protein
MRSALKRKKSLELREWGTPRQQRSMLSLDLALGEVNLFLGAFEARATFAVIGKGFKRCELEVSYSIRVELLAR